MGNWPLYRKYDKQDVFCIYVEKKNAKTRVPRISLIDVLYGLVLQIDSSHQEAIGDIKVTNSAK